MRRSLARTTGFALLACATASCADSSSAPVRRTAQIAIAPTFSAADAAIFRSLGASDVTVDNVDVVIRRSGTQGTALVDTTVAFPITATQVSIEISVQLERKEEQLDAVVALRAGNLVLFEGTQSYAARAGSTVTGDGPLAVTYVGPGADTRKLTLTTKSLGTYLGGKVPLGATATDANGSVVPTVPLIWSSTSTGTATVDALGLVTGVAIGTTSIIARTPNGVADTATFRVTAPPARLALLAGDGQRGTVGDALQQVFSVQALDAAGNGVPGATIAFSVSGGGSVDRASVLTDDKGIASARLALGTIAGDNAYTASFGAVPPITIHATSVAALPAIVSVLSGGDQVGTAGLPLPKPLVAIVTDTFGNPVSGMSVQWTATSRGGSSVGSTASDTNGTTSLNYVLPAAAGPDAVTARISGQGTQSQAIFNVMGIASLPVNIVPLAGSNFQSVDICLNATLPKPLAVQTVDQFGNAAPLANLAVTFRIDSGFATFGDSLSSSEIVLTDSLGIAVAATYAPSTNPLQTVTASAYFPGNQIPATTQFTIGVTTAGCANRLPNDGRKLPNPPTSADALRQEPDSASSDVSTL